MLTTKQLEMYLQLDFEARQKGFDNYQDKREFETGNKEELEEVREIQKEIDNFNKIRIDKFNKRREERGLY